MIDLSKDLNLMKETRKLVEFFNQIEATLDLCDSELEKQKVLFKMEQELILWGKIQFLEIKNA